MPTTKRARRVSFDASPADARLVVKVVARAVVLWREDDVKLDEQSLSMDLIATHANGCPMDFAKLLRADDLTFGHDVAGIMRHIDRRTGELRNCFVPRCAMPEGR